MTEIGWRPVRDLNPCCRRERAMSWTGLDERDARLMSGSLSNPKVINDRDNVMSPACRDEGQIILTKRRFVNRVVRLCRRSIEPPH
jgi:hypothetical protein